MSNYKFEKILSQYKSILTANPDLELHRNHAKIPLHTPDAKLLKCIDWISTKDQEMIALGYSSGRVLLGQIVQDQLQFISEFLPRHSRTCIDVAFCPVNAKLLATGLDKVRNDCGLNVWDIERGTSADDFSVNSVHGSSASISSKKPIASYGSSEGISSMAWFNDSTRIVAGMSQKWIRLFDLRDTMSSSLIFSTRAVQGIATDPFSSNRWASFSDDGYVRVFDIRKVGEPVLSFGTDYKNGIKQICWAKSRSGIIGVIGRDSPIVKIYEIQDIHHSVESYEEENDSFIDDIPILVSVRKSIMEADKFSCFTWDADSNLLLLGESIVSTPMPETVQSIISPVGNLGMAIKGEFYEMNLSNLSDISMKMYQRSSEGYNLDAGKNLALFKDGSLKVVWEWIMNMEKNASTFLKGSKDYFREGLFSLVESSIREVEDSFSNHVDSKNERFPFRSYNSSMRRKGLLMIGWDFYMDDPIESEVMIDANINASISNGKYEEAAATAFFHGMSLKRTIEALMKSPEERLKLIAISLASVENSKSSSTWKGLCGSISSEIKNPFLRSIFGLIASSGDVYSILKDRELSLKDKLGIAFRLLDDQMLLDYLEKLLNKMMVVGEVQSIILCGLSSDTSIKVLSNYLDYSGDIQTVALLSSLINQKSQNFQIKNWILCYRELLDRWRHFHQRAEFDINRLKYTKSDFEKDPGCLSLRCNYCSGPIASTHPTSTEISNCQKCRKPLPKCSVCLINMGIPIQESKEPISDWFTFCIACKHGGHVTHITNWFKLHSECPVWNCSCKCG